MRKTKAASIHVDDTEPTSFSRLVHASALNTCILKINKELIRQKALENLVFESVMNVGKALKELKDYTKKLDIKGTNTLLESFESKLPISPRIILKYIAIHENPRHVVKGHKKNLPNSITSLYELSILDEFDLQILKEEGEV